MLDQLEQYATHLNASQEVLSWLRTAGKKAMDKKTISASELEHVLDFLVSSTAPLRLQKMSIIDAKRKTEEWSKANQKKGRGLVDGEDDLEVIHDFLDGNKIVKLKTKKAFEREGFLMGHCVGGYDPDKAENHIYSYRDSKNMPHATFEVQKANNEILQIKGKGNGEIHPKYIHPILAFLKAVGMEIRPSDMANLGYHHVHKKHLDFLKHYDGIEKQTVVISGEAYAF